jgi:hypothetical protein
VQVDGDGRFGRVKNNFAVSRKVRTMCNAENSSLAIVVWRLALQIDRTTWGSEINLRWR